MKSSKNPFRKGHPISFLNGKTATALNRRFLAGLLFAFLVLSGCSGRFNLPFLATQPAVVTQSPENTPTPSVSASPTPTIPAGPQSLVLWVPSQFDPESGTPAGELLKNRLAAFASENPDVQVSVRVKAASGPGGLMDALTSASAAAPAAVPALVALSRSDLESAALKGMVYTLDGLSKEIEDPDWFPYATEMAQVQDSTFGLPFAGDAQVLLYRPVRIPNPPAQWEDILARGEPLAFAAADPQSLVTLGLYQSTGGVIQDDQGRPQVDAAALEQVLSLYADGARRGTFPVWLNQYQMDSQAWQAYREQKTPWVFNWASRYLAEMPADTTVAAIPPIDPAHSVTQATGWVWALSERDPQRQAVAVRLAEYLVEGDFLAQWSERSGYLPTRPSSLQGWKDQSLSAQLTPIVLSAHILPSNKLIASLGPVLSEATTQMLKGGSNPAEVAQTAAGKLGVP